MARVGCVCVVYVVYVYIRSCNLSDDEGEPVPLTPFEEYFIFSLELFLFLVRALRVSGVR
jgi:hypothetical protein